ncbi:hypothetical protein [Sagittula sp. SSi028]|uniref:hypothetical protein n=1 Tax=Sagittula sp. SSi028 TaxID=3400636 RepID=UPI003AF44B1A
MDPDTALISGAFLLILSVPSLLAAWANERFPFVGLLLLIGGLGLGIWAWQETGGYTADQMPEVFFRVLGRIWN